MEVNGGCLPIQWEKVDSSRKYVVSLVFNATWRLRCVGKLLKSRCSYGIIGLEFHRSAPREVLKRAKMPFMKSNGKSEFKDFALVADRFSDEDIFP